MLDWTQQAEHVVNVVHGEWCPTCALPSHARTQVPTTDDLVHQRAHADQS